MAQSAPRPCRHPGCAALVRDGFCSVHQKALRKRYDDERGSSTARGYDMAWRRVRGAYLRAHPLCECDDCKAGELRLTPAEVVDHIETIERRPDLRLKWSNLRAMSKRCHDRRTARDQGWGRS